MATHMSNCLTAFLRAKELQKKTQIAAAACRRFADGLGSPKVAYLQYAGGEPDSHKFA